ncbi:MAG: DeoR/GlpR family DNA-binding transcription regulator, partial [Clostridia bacterium]
GTTMMEFARVFPDDKYHVITYSISSIIELARLSNPQVIMLGGRLNRFNLSTIDSRNRLDLEKMNFEVAFIAVSGYSKEQGFTCGMETDDELRYAAIRKAKKVVMLMDSSKVNRVFPITYATLEDIDVLISDDGLDAETAAYMRSKGVEVY